MRFNSALLKLKKVTLLCLLLIISNLAYNQILTHQITWEKGESKKMSLKLRGKEINNGEVAKDTTIISESVLAIQDVTDTDYYVGISSENPLIVLGTYYYKDLLNELTVNQHFESNFSVNKDSLKAVNLNEKEYQKSLLDARNEILAILGKNVPDKMDLIEPQIEELYSGLNEMNVASHIINIILKSYKIEYKEGDTLITKDLDANPFNLQKFNGAELKTYMANKNRKSYDIVSEQSFNFEEYKNLIEELANTATDQLGGLIKTEDENNPMDALFKMLATQMKSIKFEASGVITTSWTTNSRWPTRILNVSDMQMTMNNNKVGGLIEILIELK